MSDRLEILNKIETGQITPQEGAQMLEGLAAKDTSSSEPQPLDQLQILEKIERGELSTEDALGLLQKASKSAPGEEFSLFLGDAPPIISDEEINKWKQWWMIPLYVGVGVIVLASFWMLSAYQNAGYNLWFFCSWVPMLAGIILVALSWGSRSGPWVHVRVNSKQERVAISLPVPIGLTSWGLRTFGHYIPNLERTSLDEILIALETTANSGQSLHIHVRDEDEGEHVDVIIG